MFYEFTCVYIYALMYIFLECYCVMLLPQIPYCAMLLPQIPYCAMLLPQIQSDIIEILVSFAIVDTSNIPTKEDGTSKLCGELFIS